MRTPAYLVIEEQLLQNYHRMRQRMAPCEIAFSMKSNPCWEIVDILAKTDARFEVCSIAEMQSLRKAGVDPALAHCGIVVMNEEEIAAFYTAGCRIFTYDSPEQLRRIRRSCGSDVSAILRVQVSDLSPGAISYGMTPKQIELEEEVLWEADGVSFHISDHQNMDATLQAIARMETLVCRNPRISLFNIGGSYSLWGDEDDYATLRQTLERIRDQYGVHLLCEPGSALANTAVDALTSCVMVQERGGFFDVFLDGGIPSGMTRKPAEIQNLTAERRQKKTIYRFFDTTSMKRLLFQTRLELELHSGDLLLFRHYGAYSYCYSNLFHSRPFPAVYRVKEYDDIVSLVSGIFDTEPSEE